MLSCKHNFGAGPAACPAPTFSPPEARNETSRNRSSHCSSRTGLHAGLVGPGRHNDLRVARTETTTGPGRPPSRMPRRPTAPSPRSAGHATSSARRGREQDQPRVVVADGRYPMTEPFVLAPQDSGVTYEAAPGARPVFSAGRIVRGFRACGERPVAGPRAGRGRGQMVLRAVVRQRPAGRAGEDAQQVLSAHGRDDGDAHRGQAGPVRPDDGGARRGHLLPLEGTRAKPRSATSCSWPITNGASRSGVSRASISRRTRSSRPARQLKSYSGWPAGTRFHLENFKVALDEPGEWFLARDGMLYYKPRPGEEIAKAEVVAPLTMKLVVFEGQPAGREVRRTRDAQGPELPAPGLHAPRRRL